MQRIALTGLGGVVLLLAAIFALRSLDGAPRPDTRAPASTTAAAPSRPTPPAPQQVAGPPPPMPATQAPAPMPAATAAAPPAHAASAAPPPTPAASAPPPRFDVVRVGTRGSAVIAGRAAPGAEVMLLVDGQREAGRSRADSRGEWVILPADPLPPGAWELSLRARLGGADVAGPDAVVVVVPQAGPASVTAAAAAAAPPPAAPPGTDAQAEAAAPAPLAVLLPEAGSAAAPRLLQGPQMVPEAPRQGGRPAPARLGMSSVDYEEGGSIRFSGTAPAGASVRVYVGDLHAGDAVANAEGRWLLLPERQPPVGRATLRVDQIAERGQVAARVEVPFQRDELPPDAFERNRVVVQPGANLWRIARAVYGRGTRFTVIYAANREQIRDPRRIFPGQIFAVPDVQATPSASSVSR
jgi:nucleoid-associated protein YgaU